MNAYIVYVSRYTYDTSRGSEQYERDVVLCFCTVYLHQLYTIFTFTFVYVKQRGLRFTPFLHELTLIKRRKE